MSKALKILHRYLLKNNLTKEADELNKIVKKSFGLLPFILTTLTGCSGHYPHLIFRAITDENSFINQQGGSPKIGIESTYPGTLYKFEGSFEDIAIEGDKQKIENLLQSLLYSDYFEDQRIDHLYDGGGNTWTENINLEKCKKIKVCYYKIEFDKIDNWDENNSAIIDNINGEDFSESKDAYIKNHPNNKSDNKWILENGAYIVPYGLAEYKLVEKVNFHIEEIFDSLSVKEEEIKF